MGWFKNAGKAVTEWFSKTGKAVARETDEAADLAKDIGENVGEFGKKAMDKISEAVGNVNIELPALPPMPDIKGPKGNNLIEQKKAWINRYISENAQLIEQAAQVAGKMAKHKDEIRAARKHDRPLPDNIMNETGARKLMSDAEDKGLDSVSFGIAGDASYGLGGNASAGINSSIVKGEGLRGAGYLAIAGSGGASVGVDGAIQIGFWEDTYNEISGWSHGVVLAGSYGGGVALAFFWKIGGDTAGDFAGWTVSPQAGFSAELEYNIGYTFN